MAESGHAMNVENWQKMIAACTGFGDDYKPSNTNLTVASMNTLLTGAGTATDGVTTKARQVRKIPYTAHKLVYNCRMNTILETSVVSRSPEIMSGAAVFDGTRVPVQSLLDYLAGGHTLDEFLDDFPTVKREQAVGLLHELGQSFELALEK